MTFAPTKSAPGSVPHTVRPPMSRNFTWLPGATSGDPMRPTAMSRPLVIAELAEHPHGEYPTTHAYVRTFWLSLVGPGAVADLLRLAAAAQSGRPLKMPLNLPSLFREGLAHPTRQGTIRVHPRVPVLTPVQVRRLPPRLRRAHLHRTPIPATADV
jgi:hypothetical protein